MSTTFRQLLGAAALVLALVNAAALSAEEKRSNSGLIVPIPAPITSEATSRLRAALDGGALRRYEYERNLDPKAVGQFYLVCDFNPDNRDNASEDFGACLTLAEYLHELRTKRGVQVIAYVHGKVTRHAVLPVLGCSERILSKEPPAQLGKIADADKPLKDWQLAAYAKLANSRIPPVVIRKMYDKSVSIVKTRRGDYRDGNARPRPQGEAVPGLGAGDTAVYSFIQAHELGLCQPSPRNSIDEVRQLYELPPSSLYPSLEHITARRILVSGDLNGACKEKAIRRIEQALRSKANLLLLELACGDGDSQAAYQLADYLIKLTGNPREPVETIAFVTPHARNTAAFVAFSCNKIIMQGARKQGERIVQESARLGDFDSYVRAHPALEETMRHNLADIAARKHYPAILAEGMLDRELRIVAVESVKEESARRFLSEADLKADQLGEHRWRSVGVTKEGGKYLTLTAEQARDLGLARDVVASFEEVCELEGVNPSEVAAVQSDWLDWLVDFLKDPWTSVILVMLGITCLILELKMPGAGLPGIISAICFLLFFWSHSQVSGEIVWLAFLLFLLGLVLIALEIFVIPGFGVTGISGIVLVVGSIGLVAYGHWPRSSEEWMGYGQALGPFSISLVGALAAAFVLARYLPNIPYVNRLMLKPRDETDEFSEEPLDSAHPEMTALLGAIGVAATPLRPAGKVQFGEDFVDVVAEGSYIMPGTRVQVIEIEGNRVVVKEV